MSLKVSHAAYHVGERVHTHSFLNSWAFDVILSSIQLSQDFKVSNGGPLIRKISVKIDRCLFKMKA